MTAAPAIIQHIPVEEIACTSNVRHANGYDDASIAELAASIDRQGLIQPIVVRETTTEDTGTAKLFHVVAGRRRYLACMKLQWPTVPAIVAHADQSAAYELEITENLQREQMTLADTARAVRTLLLIHDKPAKVCKILGKSAAWVSKHLTISSPKVPTEIAELLECGAVSDLETLLIMIQVSKEPRSADMLARLINIAKTGELSRQAARKALLTLREQNTPAPTSSTTTTTTTTTEPVTTSSTNTTTETGSTVTFPITLPASMVDRFMELGAEAWLIEQINKAGQGELPL